MGSDITKMCNGLNADVSVWEETKEKTRRYPYEIMIISMYP